jgi:hypothetical protein
MRSILLTVDQELASKVGWCLAGLFSLGTYSSLFLPLFPNALGQLGTDWGLNVFPKWLAAAYWFKTNGIFAVPHFTPGLCGGIPLLADPQSMVYSLPQLYFYFLGGITAIQLTVMTFAALGYFGSYLLLRRRFDCGRAAAFFGGFIFLFNGFFIERMSAGHATFHSFMLIPLIAFVCLSSRRMIAATGGGILFAYVVFSGGAVIVPVVGAAVFAIGLISGMKQGRFGRFLVDFTLAALLGMAIAAVKLVPALAYMAEFPRDSYLLPGFSSLWEAARIAFKLLFFESAHVEAALSLVNVQWLFGRHEFEYGVSPVPLLVLLIAAVLYLARSETMGHLKSLDRRDTGIAVLLLCILMLPLILNVYGQGWTAFLKSIPLIKNSTTLVRWFALYIPVIAVVAAIALNELAVRSSVKAVVAGLAALAIFASNFRDFSDHHYSQPYDPTHILAANTALRAGKAIPEIREITMFRQQANQPGGAVERNGDLAHGGSQLSCSEPLFGYQLEFFRWGSLESGAITSVSGRSLNIKNPACYLYPAENNCQPGDHFTVDQAKEAGEFASYKPFQWEQPMRQRFAGFLSMISLIGALSTLIIGFSRPAGKVR